MYFIQREKRKKRECCVMFLCVLCMYVCMYVYPLIVEDQYIGLIGSFCMSKIG